MSENKVYKWRNFTNNKFLVLVGSEENINEHNLVEQIVLDSPFYEFCKVFTNTTVGPNTIKEKKKK